MSDEPPASPGSRRLKSRTLGKSSSKLSRRREIKSHSSREYQLSQSVGGDKSNKAESIESLSNSFFEKVREPDDHDYNDDPTIREGDPDGLSAATSATAIGRDTREPTIREPDGSHITRLAPVLTASGSGSVSGSLDQVKRSDKDKEKKRRKRAATTSRTDSSQAIVTSRSHRSQTVVEVPVAGLAELSAEHVESLLEVLGKKLLGEMRAHQQETRAAMHVVLANQATIIDLLRERTEHAETIDRTQTVLANIIATYAAAKQHQQIDATSPHDALLSSHVSLLNEETHRLKQRLKETSELVVELQKQVEALQS